MVGDILAFVVGCLLGSIINFVFFRDIFIVVISFLFSSIIGSIAIIVTNL
jgi:hypothetical protein